MSIVVSGVNLHAVGVILLIVGALGLAISLAFWSTWGARMPGGSRRTTTVDEVPPGY